MDLDHDAVSAAEGVVDVWHGEVDVSDLVGAERFGVRP